MTLRLLGRIITVERDTDAAYHRLERRLRPTKPSPVAFALLVVALLIVAMATVRWMNLPSSWDGSESTVAADRPASV